MMRIDNRTLMLVALALLLVMVVFSPGSIKSMLDTVESLVMIALGSVATLYLWKRL